MNRVPKVDCNRPGEPGRVGPASRLATQARCLVRRASRHGAESLMLPGAGHRPVFAVGATTATITLPIENGKGFALRSLGGTCGLLCDSCRHPGPPRGDADGALEVLTELALVGGAGVRGHLCQGVLAAGGRSIPRLEAAAQPREAVRTNSKPVTGSVIASTTRWTATAPPFTVRGAACGRGMPAAAGR